MIKLKNISDGVKTEFLKYIKKPYINLLKKNINTPAYKDMINYFSFPNGAIDVSKVEKVLIGEIEVLEDAVKTIGDLSKVDGADKIKEDFDRLYTNFTQTNLGHSLTDKLGIKVCPYCNRAYIFTLVKERVRPQYDHFFSKALYPYLAVSIYNLIPSCSVCNLAKSDFDTFDKQTNSRKFIYPYRDEYGYKVKFSLKNYDPFAKLGCNQNFTIFIDYKHADKELRKKVKITKKQLKLSRLYTKHKDYVVDILKLNYVYNYQYEKGLLENFSELFHSEEELKSILFINYFPKDQWGDKILSKLTYDIVQEYKN